MHQNTAVPSDLMVYTHTGVKGNEHAKKPQSTVTFDEFKVADLESPFIR
jgi:hypothetical protein